MADSILDLAVIIVTWNVRELALNALRTLYADLEQSGLNAVVYVVDNASSDGTAQALQAAFPQAHVIASPNNPGFGSGNNLAIREIGFGKVEPAELPKAVYLLNPDTLTHIGATRALYDALMADVRTGLVGARLSYEDGEFQHSAFMFPGLRQLWVEFFPTPGRFINGGFNGRYPKWLYDFGKPFTVDVPLGATWMLKREVILQTGMFDEQIFMYCEEIDWAWRIEKAGWLTKCVPAAHITHLEGRSTRQVRPQSIINLWTSRLYVFRKHYPRWKFWLARRMIAMGMARKARREADMEIRSALLTVRDMALGKKA